MSRRRLTLGRLVPLDTDAPYVDAWAEMAAPLDVPAVTPDLPRLPRTWERFLRAEELSGDLELRRAIDRALVADTNKNARVVLTHQAGEERGPQEGPRHEAAPTV